MATMSETTEMALRWPSLSFLNQVPGPPDALMRFLQPRDLPPEKIAPRAQIRTPSALPIKDPTFTPRVHDVSCNSIISNGSSQAAQPGDQTKSQHEQILASSEPNDTNDTAAEGTGASLVSDDTATHDDHTELPLNAQASAIPIADSSRTSILTTTEASSSSDAIENSNIDLAQRVQPSADSYVADCKATPGPTETQSGALNSIHSALASTKCDQEGEDPEPTNESPAYQSVQNAIDKSSVAASSLSVSKSVRQSDRSLWKTTDSFVPKFLRRKKYLPNNVAEADQSSVSPEDALIFAEHIKPRIRILLRHKTRGMRNQQDDRASCELVMMHYDSSPQAVPVILFTCHHIDRQKQIKAALKDEAMVSFLAKFKYQTAVNLDPTLGHRGNSEKTTIDGVDTEGLPVYASILEEATTFTGTLLWINAIPDRGHTYRVFCTAGGIISVGGDWYGLTCSHAIARLLRPEYDSLDEDGEDECGSNIVPDQKAEFVARTAAVSPAPSDSDPDFDWLLLKLEPQVSRVNDITEMWPAFEVARTEDGHSPICVLRTSRGALTGRICAGTTMIDIGLASYDALRIELEEPLRKPLSHIALTHLTQNSEGGFGSMGPSPRQVVRHRYRWKRSSGNRIRFACP